MPDPAPERAIAPNEVAIIRWLLANASLVDTSALQRIDLTALRVVGGCDCGCRSVEFCRDLNGAAVVAEAVALYPDGVQAGVMLFARKDGVTELEFYDKDLDASHRLPEPSQLRTYEALGREAAGNGAA